MKNYSNDIDVLQEFWGEVSFCGMPCVFWCHTDDGSRVYVDPENEYAIAIAPDGTLLQYVQFIYNDNLDETLVPDEELTRNWQGFDPEELDVARAACQDTPLTA